MVITESYIVRSDGVQLVRTYSDEGYMIEQVGTGAIYDIAIDPADSGRTYLETTQPIEGDDATVDDYEAALHDLGVL